MPYTYIVKNITTGMLYYGVRFAKSAKPDDFWVSYFTSSKFVKDLIRQFGKEDFIFEIRREFTTVEGAINWEQRVLRRFAVNHPKFLNRDTSQRPDLTLQCKIKTKFVSNPELGEVRRVPYDMEIPDGWVRGNRNATRKDLGRKWYYEESGKLHHCLPENAHPSWKEGRPGVSNSKAITGKIAISNGPEIKLIHPSEPIPEGWSTGVGNRKKPSGKRRSKWKWICNFETAKQIREDDPTPEGWILGMKPTTELLGDSTFPFLAWKKREDVRRIAATGYRRRRGLVSQDFSPKSSEQH